MKDRQSSSRVAQGSSKITPKGVRLTEKQTQKIGSDTPASAKEEVIESSSSMTTTVVGASAVAAPDSEVKMTNH
jgi:hypothetical protein